VALDAAEELADNLRSAEGFALATEMACWSILNLDEEL
jgi:hypothetical protein